MGDILNIINGIRSYIMDSEFEMIVLNNKINVVNYKDIGHFDNNKIVIKTNYKDIIIKGNDLVVSKLLCDEILITGNFNSIEFR